jgi:hypothetical protein
MNAEASRRFLVKQKTIEPFMKETIAPGTLVYTDEYSIYARLHA